MRRPPVAAVGALPGVQHPRALIVRALFQIKPKGLGRRLARIVRERSVRLHEPSFRLGGKDFNESRRPEVPIKRHGRHRAGRRHEHRRAHRMTVRRAHRRLVSFERRAPHVVHRRLAILLGQKPRRRVAFQIREVLREKRHPPFASRLKGRAPQKRHRHGRHGRRKEHGRRHPKENK